MIIDLFLVFKGLIAGFFYSFIAISGALYTAHFVLKRGWGGGFVASLGVITTHLFWAFLGALLLNLCTMYIHTNYRTFSLIGSILLFFIALRAYRAKPPEKEPPTFFQMPDIYIGGLVLSLKSPTRIIGYAAIFATIGEQATQKNFLDLIPLLIGVLIGLLIWWCILITMIDRSKEGLSTRMVLKIQKSSAIILISFSAFGLLEIYLF